MKLSPAENKEKWMTCPTGNVVYPGLAYIYHLNKLIVREKLDELHECMGKIETGYIIYNNLSEKVFLAVRQRHECHDQSFFIKVFNHYGNEVINIKISKPCIWFLYKAAIWAPPDNYVGSVEQKHAIRDFTLIEKFLVKNWEGKVVLEIMAHSSNNFVYSLRCCGEEMGVIMENWGGGDNNFGVSFPEDLAVGDKAVVLGACFLIGCLKY